MQNTTRFPQSRDGIVHGPNGYTTANGQALGGNSLAQARNSMQHPQPPMRPMGPPPTMPQQHMPMAGMGMPMQNTMNTQVMGQPSFIGGQSSTNPMTGQMQNQNAANAGAMGGMPGGNYQGLASQAYPGSQQMPMGNYAMPQAVPAPTTNQVFGQLQNNSIPGYMS